MNEETEQIPGKNQTCALAAPDVVKRAALLFDRVAIMAPAHYYSKPVDEDANADEKPGLHSRIHLAVTTVDDMLAGIPKLIAFRLPEWMRTSIASQPIPVTPSSLASFLSGRKLYTLHLHMCKQRGLSAVRVFGADWDMTTVSESETNLAYQAGLQSLPVVAEDASWDQILDFREDEDAVRKYRALRHWLADALAAKTLPEAQDAIERKLDNYSWAVEKHGLKTITGALSAIFEWKQIVMLAGGASIGAVVGGEIGAMLGAGFLTLGRVSVWFAERRIEREDIEYGPDAEVALIYDVRKRFAGNQEHKLHQSPGAGVD